MVSRINYFLGWCVFFFFGDFNILNFCVVGIFDLNMNVIRESEIIVVDFLCNLFWVRDWKGWEDVLKVIKVDLEF